MLLLLYGMFHYFELVNHEDYRVQLRSLESFFDSGDNFGSQDGFMVAAALFSNEGSIDDNFDITDPEIGEIKFYLKQWDAVTGKFSLSFKEIESKICEEEDLND